MNLVQSCVNDKKNNADNRISTVIEFFEVDKRETQKSIKGKDFGFSY